MIAKETHHNNQLIFSNLKEFYEPVKATGFSIKYVVCGTEVYTLNNEQHIVKNNQYLLSNIEKEGVVEIESKQLVKGICISIDRNLIKEVVDFVIQPDSNCVEEDVTNF
jgi:predicted nucleotidyltransferase